MVNPIGSFKMTQKKSKRKKLKGERKRVNKREVEAAHVRWSS
jgi:hypothetical protein